jgi:hypothetical protein
MDTSLPACPVRDPKNRYRPVKWLRMKEVSGYSDWKCICCKKVATEHHLFTQSHLNNVAYWHEKPGWYEDSEDETYAELYKQEEAEDKRAIEAGDGQTPSSASTWIEGARAAGAAPTTRSQQAALSRRPVSGPSTCMQGAIAAGAAPTARSQPAALSRAAGPTPSSAATFLGRAREAGPAAQTEIPATKAARLRMILDNSVKIQKLVREVNQLAAQTAEQVVLLEAVLREPSGSA